MDGRNLARSLVTPITLLLLLAVLAFGGWWGYKHLTAPLPPAPIASCTPQPVGQKLASKKVKVNIYNGGRKRGLASQVANTMKARQFVVDQVDNTEDRVTTTQVIGVTTDDPAVKLVLAQFKNAEAVADGQSDGVVDVKVGTQYGGMNDTKSPWQVDIKGPACVAPSPTPSTIR